MRRFSFKILTSNRTFNSGISLFFALMSLSAIAAASDRFSLSVGQSGKDDLYLQLWNALPAVVVDGATITQGDIKKRMDLLRREDGFAVHKKFENQTPAGFRKFVRDELIDEAVALQEALKRGIWVQPEEIEARLHGVIAQDSEQAFGRLTRLGLIDDDLREHCSRNLMIEKLRELITADFPAPTTTEMRAFYEANKLVFETTPERVSARKIHLLKPKKAKLGSPEFQKVIERGQAILERLKQGENFSKVANLTTEDPGGLGKGGSLGWVTRAMADKSIVEVLFSQEVGVIPEEPLVNSGGVYILLVEAHEAPAFQPFPEAIPRIMRGMKIEKFKDWLARKRTNATIYYYENLPQRDVLEGKKPKKTSIRY